MRQYPAGDTIIDSFQKSWYLASIAWILFTLVITHGIKVFQKNIGVNEENCNSEICYLE